ncbi:hypothetical protein TREAZ_0172 [Leadbettera azotonutricia ZAS-9]|uniref:Uncharacterized protein n=1 Tax=Leadbettera azotonutricia (strain ATCC BAA-888 / DSM 13862 / ZAS-9) TaxID=545695 RepID=F5YEV4_LEAAZ|nr:hypothetical protein TREAZ_0172 [Leadbettera azotonutricia ZAS-9]
MLEGRSSPNIMESSPNANADCSSPDCCSCADNEDEIKMRPAAAKSAAVKKTCLTFSFSPPKYKLT